MPGFLFSVGRERLVVVRIWRMLHMWSMWNAPSDRDYYEAYGWDEEDDQSEYCQHCGARWDQACEEWCDSNAPASEALSAGQTEPEESPGIRPAVSICASTCDIGTLVEDSGLESIAD
jgi:hypothetical protein